MQLTKVTFNRNDYATFVKWWVTFVEHHLPSSATWVTFVKGELLLSVIWVTFVNHMATWYNSETIGMKILVMKTPECWHTSRDQCCKVPSPHSPLPWWIDTQTNYRQTHKHTHTHTALILLPQLLMREVINVASAHAIEVSVLHVNGWQIPIL